MESPTKKQTTNYAKQGSPFPGIIMHLLLAKSNSDESAGHPTACVVFLFR